MFLTVYNSHSDFTSVENILCKILLLYSNVFNSVIKPFCFFTRDKKPLLYHCTMFSIVLLDCHIAFTSVEKPLWFYQYEKSITFYQYRKAIMFLPV